MGMFHHHGNGRGHRHGGPKPSGVDRESLRGMQALKRLADIKDRREREQLERGIDLCMTLPKRKRDIPSFSGLRLPFRLRLSFWFQAPWVKQTFHCRRCRSLLRHHRRERALFFAGLALRRRVAGCFAYSVARPLLLYASLEIAVAITGEPATDDGLVSHAGSICLPFQIGLASWSSVASVLVGRYSEHSCHGRNDSPATRSASFWKTFPSPQWRVGICRKHSLEVSAAPL